MARTPAKEAVGEVLWRCHERGGPAHDRNWEYRSTISAEEPGEAARRFVVEAWASGTHEVLVVNSLEAREFKVTIESEEVGVDG